MLNYVDLNCGLFHEVGPTGDSNPSRTEYVSKLAFTLTKEDDHRQLSVANMEWSHGSLQPRSVKPTCVAAGKAQVVCFCTSTRLPALLSTSAKAIFRQP